MHSLFKKIQYLKDLFKGVFITFLQNEPKEEAAAEKRDCVTDGHQKAGDPWSFLACCESIINGDFSSYRPIPCREERQQSLPQNASIPAKWLAKEANRQRWADGAKLRNRRGDERRSKPAEMACPRHGAQDLLTRALHWDVPWELQIACALHPHRFVYRKIFKMETWLHF